MVISIIPKTLLLWRSRCWCTRASTIRSSAFQLTCPNLQGVESCFGFPQRQNFAMAMGSLAQISSGAIQCSFNTRFWTRFRRVPVQIPREGSGGFWWRYFVRFWTVPVQIPCEVPEGSGADALWGSGSFRCRYSVRFRRVTVQILG